jgi:hypothetical protein
VGGIRSENILGGWSPVTTMMIVCASAKEEKKKRVLRFLVPTLIFPDLDFFDDSGP